MIFQRIPYINIIINVLPDSCGMENRRVWGPACFFVQAHLSPALKYLLLLPEIREPLVPIACYIGKDLPCKWNTSFSPTFLISYHWLNVFTVFGIGKYITMV